MWVPLVEYGEFDSPGADYFVKKRIDEILRIDPDIDTLVLGCTHYPLLLPAILRHVPRGITVVPQGDYVAHFVVRLLAATSRDGNTTDEKRRRRISHYRRAQQVSRKCHHLYARH